MSLLVLDKNHPECCAIDSQGHIKSSLGEPLTLPDCLQDQLSEKWANECEDDLLALFKLMTGENYKEVHRDNTYNSPNDLSQFFVFTVYAPVDCPDWCWHRGCFVAVEMGTPGDPRYCSYSPAEVFYLDDDCIADTGFLDWNLGWWIDPINSKNNPNEIDWLNDRITPGYSSEPYYELTKELFFEPIWSDEKESFVARPKDCNFACKVMPLEPHYGG